MSGKSISLMLREATFTGRSAKMNLLDTDSLLIALGNIRDVSSESHTINNINKLIGMIHELHLNY